MWTIRNLLFGLIESQRVNFFTHSAANVDKAKSDLQTVKLQHACKGLWVKMAL